MNKPNINSYKVTFIVAIILLIVNASLVIASFGSALAGINPDNQNTQLVYPVHEDAVDTIWHITIVATVLGLVIALIAGVNIKYRNPYARAVMVIACGIMAMWFIFACWALNGTYVSKSSTGQDSGSLRIRSIDLR